MRSTVKPFRYERVNATGPKAPANDTNLELGDLTIEVPRHEALTRQFQPMHPCLDAVSVVMPAPLRARFQTARFLVLQAGDVGLLMSPSYNTGFTV